MIRKMVKGGIIQGGMFQGGIVQGGIIQRRMAHAGTIMTGTVVRGNHVLLLHLLNLHLAMTLLLRLAILIGPLQMMLLVQFQKGFLSLRDLRSRDDSGNVNLAMKMR